MYMYTSTCRYEGNEVHVYFVSSLHSLLQTFSFRKNVSCRIMSTFQAKTSFHFGVQKLLMTRRTNTTFWWHVIGKEDFQILAKLVKFVNVLLHVAQVVAEVKSQIYFLTYCHRPHQRPHSDCSCWSPSPRKCRGQCSSRYQCTGPGPSTPAQNPDHRCCMCQLGELPWILTFC